jgi:hypothetical protein
VQENHLWTAEKFSRGQAWIDLILLTNHKPSYFYKRDIKVSIERGQCGVSELGLSDRWKWSRTKVKKFLKDLEKEHQIVVEKNNVTQVVTVLNYDKYQSKEQQEDTKKTPKEHQEDTNKNVKNEKNTVTTEHVRIAERVKNILSLRKEKTIKESVMKNWANTIRLMEYTDGVEVVKIDKALDWYEKHWRDDFVPVIESAKALREKFDSLLNAIDRAQKSGGTRNSESIWEGE